MAPVLIDADASHSLGDGISLALDRHERLRFAYAAGSSGLLGYCDGDCVGRSGADDWSLRQVESVTDSVADDVFLYESCNEGAWFLRQPALAVTADGLPSVAYRAEDKSGGWASPDPTKPPCAVGVDMSLTKLRVLDSYL